MVGHSTKIPKIELLPTQDCEVGYAPDYHGDEKSFCVVPPPSPFPCAASHTTTTLQAKSKISSVGVLKKCILYKDSLKIF